MEVPAKRTVLAPRDLNLLDLDDDALIMIIKKLDHGSKLQTMATCKRFEGLIGHTHQFYKNFKFRYDQEKFQESEDLQLQQIRRCFEIVEITGGSREMKDYPLKPSVLEFLKKHSADILKIKLHNLAFHKAVFLELMKAMQEIRELEICEIKFTGTRGIDHFKLKHLTKLDICWSTNLGFCTTFVPASLRSLKINCMWDRETLDPEMLGKQKGLEELSLVYCGIEEFKFDPENCHIEKLTIDDLEFLNDRAFEKFGEFVKIQESVVELELSIQEEELEIRNQKKPGILTHLLGLKSLKKVTIDCKYEEDIPEVFPGLKVCNPAVETLIIANPYLRVDHLKSLSKFFPNVTDLKITWPVVIFYEFPNNVDFQPINSMKRIRKLEIQFASDEILAQLELKELREFHVFEVYSLRYRVDDSDDDDLVNPLANWRTFINNHSQLEVLQISESKTSVEQLQIALENLPLLKNLEFTVHNFDFVSEIPGHSSDEYKKEQAEKTARLIAEKYDRLERLKLDFSDDDNNFIFIYLEKKKFDVKLWSF